MKIANNTVNTKEKIKYDEELDEIEREINRIIEYILPEEMTKAAKEELIKKIQIGWEKKMNASDVIGREFKIRYENGRKDGRKEILKAMLKEKLSIEQISRITVLSKNEIKKIQMEKC